MSQSAALLARGQAFLATEFPAAIKIGPQSYAAGTSGLRAQAGLGAGGFESLGAVSFWLPLSAFTDAGQPLPEAQRTGLTCLAPESVKGEWQIEAVLTDGAGGTVTLRCIPPAT
jgi:hypothetical protein